MYIILEKQRIIECPFCKKLSIETYYTLPYYTTSKGPWGGRPQRKRHEGKERIESGCKFCGKSKEEVEKVLKKSKKNDSKILKRLKKDGVFKSELVTKF